MRYDPDDRSILPGDDFRRQPRIDQELPPDSEPAGDPASGGKIAMFAVAIAIVLGVIFYGLNDSSIRQAGTSTAQNTNQSSPPAAPPGMRDVTPRANTDTGMTTGAAPARPQPPPAAPAK